MLCFIAHIKPFLLLNVQLSEELGIRAVLLSSSICNAIVRPVQLYILSRNSQYAQLCFGLICITDGAISKKHLQQEFMFVPSTWKFVHSFDDTYFA